MVDNTRNSSFTHPLSPEEIFELVAEIIPGINHKSNNLLTRISGHVLLAQLEYLSKENRKNLETIIPDFCDQLARLLNKMLVLVRSTEKTSQKESALDCLTASVKRFHSSSPHRSVKTYNRLVEDSHLWGDEKRFQRLYYFVLMILDLCSDPGDVIRITIENASNLSSPVVQKNQENKRGWILIVFCVNSDSHVLTDSSADFFNEETPVNLLSCYLAAVETIAQSYGGRLNINAENGIQIATYLPQRSESPTQANQNGKNQKERVYFPPHNNPAYSGSPIEKAS